MVIKKIDKTIQVNPLKIETLKIKIIGNSPLLMNKYSTKESESMLNKQLGKGAEKNKIRDPKQEVEDKIHKLSDGTIGIPAESIKSMLVNSAPALGLFKISIKGGLFVIPVDNNLVPIKYKKMVVNKSITRDSGITKAPRTTFRPEFRDWSCEFIVRYNAAQITTDQIINLLKVGGFHNGLGSWSPRSNGTYGTFVLFE